MGFPGVCLHPVDNIVKIGNFGLPFQHDVMYSLVLFPLSSIYYRPYSFILMDNQPPAPVPFSPDAFFAPGVPHQAKSVHILDHGEVVCAVTINNIARHVYTGGKGTVKVWDLAQITSHNIGAGGIVASSNSPVSNTVGSSPSSSLGLTPSTKLCLASLDCLQRDKYVRSIKLTQVRQQFRIEILLSVLYYIQISTTYEYAISTSYPCCPSSNLIR